MASLVPQVACKPRVGGGNIAGLAFDCGAEHDAVVSAGAHRLLDGAKHISGSDRQRK